MGFFEKITDGLHSFEVILMLLGAIMFIALLVMMIVYALQKRTLKPLFIFFTVPLLMLLWPSIQKIKITGEGAEIERKVDAVQQNPSKENKEELNLAVENLESRNVQDPDVVKRIIKAHYLLGDTKAATQTIQTLPKDQAADPIVNEVRKSIAVTGKLEEQIKAVNQTPSDSSEVRELNRLRLVADKLQVKNEQVKADILVADQKVVNYKKVNPKMDFRTQLVRQ